MKLNLLRRILDNKETLKETIEKKTRKEKYLKIFLITIFCVSLLFIGFVIGNPKIFTNIKGSLENITKRDTRTIENQDVSKIGEEKGLENTEEIPKVPTEEEKPPVEEPPKGKIITTQKISTPVETKPTTPTLKCTQYEYDYATEFIPAATKVYNELSVSYQKEVVEFESCMYGQTWNELYEMCDSKLSSLITDPLARGNLIRQCIQSYYSDCEMNDSSEWYETQMANKLAAINVQKSILNGCY